jgi:hypothetical protein
MGSGTRSGSIARSSIVLGVALALHAPGAAAQSHHLLARPGSVFSGDSTTDPNDDHVEETIQSGVAGVNPTFYSNHAVVDSASGHLHISSSMSRLGGAQDPLDFPTATNLDPVALVEQALDIEDLGGGTIRASLQVSGFAAVTVDGPGVGPIFFFEANLALDDCQVLLRLDTGPAGTDPPEIVDNCIGDPDQQGHGDANTLAVEGDFGSSAQLVAQIRVDTAYFSLGDAAAFDYTGALRVTPDQASVSYASPTFLTQVPEPEAGALGVSALGALAALPARARRR